jgi:hypothetical protein
MRREVRGTVRMKTTIAIAAAAVVVALPSVARADGYINTVRTRFYTDYTHFSISYEVLDTGGNCVPDEFGGYSDPNCYAYDSNDATLDVRVFQTGGWFCRARCTRLRQKRVFSESFTGSGGRATEDLYGFEVHRPYCLGYGATYDIGYQAAFRLYDPVTDSVVDRTSKFFHYWCR